MSATLERILSKADLIILLASGIDEHRNIIKGNLRGVGYQNFRGASNGQSALALAKRNNPHLVIADTTMRNLFGYEVCEQLKRFQQARQQQPDGAHPTVFIGMYAGKGQHEQYQQDWNNAGVNVLVNKADILHGLNGNYRSGAPPTRAQQILEEAIANAFGQYGYALR